MNQHGGHAGFQAAVSSGLISDGEDNLLKRTFDTVFVPFRSIGGLDRTAMAIREVARSAEEINLTAQRIPLLTRWNMELILYQAEAAGDKTLAGIQQASVNLAQAGTAREGMIRSLDDFVGGFPATRDGHRNPLRLLKSNGRHRCRLPMMLTGSSSSRANGSRGGSRRCSNQNAGRECFN